MKGTFVRSKARTPRRSLGVFALLLTKVPFISDYYMIMLNVSVDIDDDDDYDNALHCNGDDNGNVD